jgi:hypothetical protein
VVAIDTLPLNHSSGDKAGATQTCGSFRTTCGHTIVSPHLKCSYSFHFTFTQTDQVCGHQTPGENYDPLLMSLVTSISINVDEGEETV